MKYSILGLLLIFSTSAFCGDPSFYKPVEIPCSYRFSEDGNTSTLRCLKTKKDIKIQHYCIDAPEIDQLYGKISKKNIEFEIRDAQEVKYILYKDDNGEFVKLYDKSYYLGDIIIDGAPVSLVQVTEGLAYVDPLNCSAPEYFKAEKNARRFKKEIWSQSTPMRPWDFRKAR